MRNSLLLAAGLCCLLTQTANSQAMAPIGPAPPRVVSLDPGDVAQQAYVCLDTATYRVVRRQVAQLEPLRQRVALLDYDRTLLAQSLAQQHMAGRLANADFTVLAHDSRQLEMVRPMPPLLLSPHFYKGIGVGTLLAIAAKLYFHL